MSPRKESQKSARKTSASSSKSGGFTAEERAAMKEYAQERKAEARRGASGASGANADAEREGEVLAKIAAMEEPDRGMAERVHAIIRATAPGLAPRLWYGMPAYARDGNVVCFFQDARKFKSRYATLGFSDKAKLDEGALWPVAFALKELTAAAEARIAELVKKATS